VTNSNEFEIEVSFTEEDAAKNIYDTQYFIAIEQALINASELV
jgi:hypothetical protein